MAAATSRWREHARHVINEVLRRLPPTVDDKIVRAALREAYPFGERAMHPYKIWCDEVKKRLRPAHNIGTPFIAVEIVPRPKTEEECEIRCGWCGSSRGCLMCGRAREEAVANVKTTDWKMLAAFVSAIKAEPDEPVHLGAFADWLTDNGWPELARCYSTRIVKEDLK